MKQRSPNEPFFLYVCYHEPHEPIASAKQYTDLYATLANPAQHTHRRKLASGSAHWLHQHIGLFDVAILIRHLRCEIGADRMVGRDFLGLGDPRRRLLLVALIGMILAIGFLATPAVFGARETLGITSAQAGTLARSMLGPLEWVTLAVVVLLLSLEPLRRTVAGRIHTVILGFLLGMLALCLVEMLVVTPAIQQLRESILLA